MSTISKANLSNPNIDLNNKSNCEEKSSKRNGVIRNSPYQVKSFIDEVIVVKKPKPFESEIKYLMDESQWKNKKEYKDAAQDVVNALTQVPDSENEIIVMYKTDENGVRKYIGLYFLDSNDSECYGIHSGEMEYEELMRDIERLSQCSIDDDDDKKEHNKKNDNDDDDNDNDEDDDEDNDDEDNDDDDEDDDYGGGDYTTIYNKDEEEDSEQSPDSDYSDYD